MKTRIVAGVTAAVLLLLLLIKGSLPLITTVILACAALAYLEFDRLFFEPQNTARQTRIVLLVFLTILSIEKGMEPAWLSLWFSVGFLAIWQVAKTGKSGEPVEAVRCFTLEVCGFLYVVGLFGFLSPIVRHGEWGRSYLLLLFLMVFMGDTAAYFIGTLFGKHKLAPGLSPNKSVEGAVAAILTATLFSWVWVRYMNHPEPLKLVLFAPFVSVLAQIGDLFESLFKRCQRQKDSGFFLPGHGGLLDRVDGLFLSSAAFYFFLIFVIEGSP